MKRALIYFIYNIITLAAILIFSPYLIYLLARGRKDEIGERLGVTDFADSQKLNGSQVIWLHGASVGEMKAAGEVMRELQDRAEDDYYFLVTTMTPQGRRLARNQLTKADHICYLPADFPPLIYFFIRRLQPDVLLLLETELWPGVIRESIRRGTRVAVFNGRISDDSFSSYRKIKFLLAPFVKLITRFFMQSRRDCERIKKLGAPEKKVKLSGNIKYSGALEEASRAEADFELRGNRPVIVAGSTHDPEEKILLRILKKLKDQDKVRKPLLILAPRHVERRDEIISLMEAENFNWQQRSEGVSRIEEETEVFLLDTIGELIGAYKEADLAFIGGTLAEVGGHNFLEPLACGIPVILGPSIYEIEDDLEEFESIADGHSLSLVSGEKELTEKMQEFLESENISNFTGSDSAQKILHRQGQRVRDQIEEIFSLLPLSREEKKVLLIRLSALGDVIHTLPAFSLLAKKRSKYELHWLVEPLAAPLVKNSSFVDKTRVFPRHELRGGNRLKGIERLKKLCSFLREMDDPGYDLTFDIHGILKSALPSSFARGDISYGRCDGKEGSRLFYKRLLRFFEEKDVRHKVEENLELMASALGCRVPDYSDIDYGIKLPEGWYEDLPAELRALLDFSSPQKEENRGSTRTPIGVIHPLSSWPSKNWLMERYRLLAQKLLKAGWKIIFSGSNEQRGRLQGTVTALQQESHSGRIYNAAGRIDLLKLYGILKEVDFFLGADTGPMHLAAAADTKVAAIMGPTDPEVYGPYCSTSRVIRNKKLDCLVCGEKKCPQGHHRCMQDLSVDGVLQEIKNLLSERAADIDEH
ncbi:glycosyltransferase N-terminal domain-containing protein [Halarsenatibacter silvermanii]|uniref:3-deoxy-D-manno-octulosonic-acid transferase n=1 Tax=Halarsenatibacter silvermanii TaxID=321763 RepID=A0A1G9I013_9FIRM|nr:glycosyltransferase N-terminal domain-containing protein [Halarsenatibacter silvermanii]SDL18577.1 3-deoxy-D-manno-octulosonic-acid transferase [Halarsenatibacter silvermanii]